MTLSKVAFGITTLDIMTLDITTPGLAIKMQHFIAIKMYCSA